LQGRRWKQIEQISVKINMNTKQQLDDIQKAIDAIRENLGLNRSEKPNSSEPDYTHLLPEGYEFCAEQDAEKWVKVEMFFIVPESEQMQVGYIWNSPTIPSTKRYRPIRPIAYHIAVHEAVTAEPDPYQVDWSNAPEWADVHCFDRDRRGYWYGHRYNVLYSDWETMTIGSNFNLPEGAGIERKFSKTIRPKLK
jgi:hypothetical protein